MLIVRVKIKMVKKTIEDVFKILLIFTFDQLFLLQKLSSILQEYLEILFRRRLNNMVRIFEWLSQQFRNFNSWFVTSWNNIIHKLLFKNGL